MIGKQEFAITDDDNIKVVQSTMWSRSEVMIPLCELDPNYSHVRQVSWQSLLCTIIFLVPSCILLLVAIFNKNIETDMVVFFVSLSVVFFLATLFCWISYLKQYVNVVAFYSKRNGQLLISMWNELPNKEEFNNFVAKVAAMATESFDKLVGGSKEDLASEILSLHKLKEQGILNEDEFARAKSKLIENAEPRTIGFR